MKRINLVITARSPLAIGKRKPGGSVSEAADYIPGTVIRGAIAAQMLRDSKTQPQTGDDFSRLFLGDTAAIFSNGYCAIAAEEDPDNKTLHHIVCNGDIRVIPASALSSKTKPGFKPDKAGAFDSLIDSFCAKAHGHFYIPNDLAGDLVDAFSGFYSIEKRIDKGKEWSRYYSHTLSKRLLTRVGINRRRATAQDEMLYSIEVMEESHAGKHQPEPTVYRSSILVRDAKDLLAEGFCTFLKQRCQKMRLGGSASRGLGRVSVEVSDAPGSRSNEDEIRKRVDNFNNTLKERWALWSVLGEASANLPDERLFFTLNFQSDAILREHWQRTTVVSPKMLADVLEIENAEVITLHAAYTSYDYQSGWNAAWGLPKDTELATKKGSVLLFSLPKVTVQTKLYSRLVDLERNGIGEKCSEGYGRINICDEFHQNMRENPV